MQSINTLSSSSSSGVISTSILGLKCKTWVVGCLLTASQMVMSHMAAAGECKLNIVDNWGSGFKGEVTIINEGPATREWDLYWEWDNITLKDTWNATYQCSATACSASEPAWQPELSTGESYTFGFVADGTAPEYISVSGSLCGDTVPGEPSVKRRVWTLEASTSALQYVSMKKEHTAEVNTFKEAAGASPALSGSISKLGEVVFAIDLNDVATGVEKRNTRLLSMLFETEWLPTAYLTASIDASALASQAVGETTTQPLDAELSLHGMRQSLATEVMVTKLTETSLLVSSLKPVLIDSKAFDMASGIEALRVVANLTSIGEMVPVYFQLHFTATDGAQVITMPQAPTDPTQLTGRFDVNSTQSVISWDDNSQNETGFIVRRKPVDGRWKTVANLSSNLRTMREGLPNEGEYDYKVIAINQGVPSLPTNVARVTVTAGNQIVRGQEMFQDMCAGCHGDNGEGSLNFPPLTTEWNDMDALVNKIMKDMPLGNPGACDAQCAADVAKFIETLWVTEMSCNINETPISYGARQLKLLTRTEYQNTVHDLLGIEQEVASGLSADTQVGFFENNTHASVIPASYSNYLLVAEEVAKLSAEKNFAPLLSCASGFDESCAESLVNDAATKIFRRPLNEEEKESYLKIAKGSHTSGDIKAGITMALEGMLSSPQFLYRSELGETNTENREIDGDAFELTSYEMATFLAYTFTESTPDDLLLAAAAKGELRDEAKIAAQAARLANKSKPMLGVFVGSWLGTKTLQNAVKDDAKWPGFANLVPLMKQEINDTFAHVMMTPEESFSSLYDGDYTYINQTLAEHYGINGVAGNDFRQVFTTDRGGILASGAFMARWGESVETSPILRSVRVRRRMLCQDQPDPPAGTFEAREKKLAELSEFLKQPETTNRMKYHRLTEDAPCTNCHTQYINPMGFGMENFDTVGRIRTTDLKGNAIDASGKVFAPLKYSDVDESIAFTGTKGLGEVLSELSSAQACLPKQMFRYVMGVGYQSIDPKNPEGLTMTDAEKKGYACEVKQLRDTMMANSPRAMLERFGILQSVRYRKAWARR